MLAGVFLGATSLPSNILLDTLAESLSAHDVAIIRDSLHLTKSMKTFPPRLSDGLVSILSCFGCRQNPCCTNLNRLFREVAEFEFGEFGADPCCPSNAEWCARK